MMAETISFHNSDVDIWTQKSTSLGDALRQTTHLAIGAHQDDLEIMAYEGIATCYRSDEMWFSGIVVTDGRGSSRGGPYECFDDEQMRATRLSEQRKAAEIGRYSSMIQLDYRSDQIKGKEDGSSYLQGDLEQVLLISKPHTVYLHQPADKHDTHVAALLRCIDALRNISDVYLPRQILGCEVWRGLDWLDDSEKIAMDCSLYPELAKELLVVFDSQISGGKNYDAGTIGRRCANATYFDARKTDEMSSISWAIDLKPLIKNNSLSMEDFILEKLSNLILDVENRIHKNR